MASIRSRNGRYQVQVRRAGLGSRSRTFVLKQDAERWARKMEAQFDQGELQQLTTKDVLLHDLIDRYRCEITPSKEEPGYRRGEACPFNAGPHCLPYDSETNCP